MAADTHIKKWAMRELVITMVFFFIGFVILPSGFFTHDETFNGVLAGVGFGIGISRLIHFLKLAKSGKTALDTTESDCI